MFRSKIFWIVLIALVLAVTGGGYYYSNIHLQAQEPEAETIATGTVTRGDLIITASGSGTLVPSSEIAVGFPGGGRVAEVLVDVGDTVEAGQIVARLDDVDAQDQVAQAEIALRQAELDLSELLEEADPADLAGAQASLSSAKANLAVLTSPPGDQDLLSARENLTSAKEALDDLKAGPDPDDVEIARTNLTLAEMNVRTAQTAYDKIAWQDDVGSSQQATDLWQATTNYEQAQAEHQEALEGATEEELASARSQVALAQAQLDALLEGPDPDEIAAAEAQVSQAQAQIDELLSGASAQDLEAAALSVTQARLNLESARRDLEGMLLVAPVSGTATAVSTQAGESVGTEAIVTLADLQEPQVLFWVEEADLISVSPGNAVNIVFEALPDLTFSGVVLRVDPVLVDVDGTPAVQSYASLDLSADPVTLLSGMNAEVEVVAGEAQDAVLVPLQALRELGTEQHAVFVVLPNGELEMRIVEVGLRDFVNAEILSGLEPGEIVSTGVETSTDISSAPETGGDDAPPPGMFRFLGG